MWLKRGDLIWNCARVFWWKILVDLTDNKARVCFASTRQVLMPINRIFKHHTTCESNYLTLIFKANNMKNPI